MNIIENVDTPIEWISSMLCARKANGKLCVCIDPRPLNKALERSHYMIPVFDDVLPKLSGAKVFSVVNVQNEYWNLKLDPESNELTTMKTRILATNGYDCHLVLLHQVRNSNKPWRKSYSWRASILSPMIS